MVAVAALIVVTIAAILFIVTYDPAKQAGGPQPQQITENPVVTTGGDKDMPQGNFDSVKVAADGRSVQDADTGKPVFTIEEAHRFIQDSGYDYDEDTFQTTDAKYAGDCISEAVLSHDKESIAFITSCLPGDLPQSWIGIYRTDGFRFVYGGGGDTLVWADDDKSISFEAYLGLTGWTFAKSVDVATGGITAREDCSTYELRKKGSKDMCYHESAEVDRDEKICGQIGLIETRSDCYVDLAILKDDYDICKDNELTAALASDCAEHFGIRRK